MGAFVKFEKGKWYEVSLRYAREKVITLYIPHLSVNLENLLLITCLYL